MSITISLIMFASVFGGAILGMFLRKALPQEHLGSESKRLMRWGTGLIGTMAALVLGLLIASAKSSFDTRKSELTAMSANIVLLDRVLVHYGPESKEARDLLHRSVIQVLERMWPEGRPGASQLAPGPAAEALNERIEELSPKNENQRILKERALNILAEIAQTRWLLFEQVGSSIPMPFLVVVVFWLTIIFVSFGIRAAANPTVIVTLLVCALSVSSAIFLILEMDQPFGGLIQISNLPLRMALAHIGQ